VSARIALLDVNVLVALFDPDHPHHEPAHDWLVANRSSGWATCPLTENGLLRILSNVAYSGAPLQADAVRERLTSFCESGQHESYPDDISLLERGRFRLAGVTHRQLTDIYLLGLAVHHGGRLATFDRGIPRHAVLGAGSDQLVVIPA
jgi:toxin-antitoxin system PIN domain toxin